MEERDERVKRKERERINVDRQQNVNASQASSLRLHIEASISSRPNMGSTQGSQDSLLNSQQEKTERDEKKRKF